MLGGEYYANNLEDLFKVRHRHSQSLVLPVMLCKLIAQWNVRYEVCKNDD